MSAKLLSIPEVVDQLSAGSRATVYRLIHAGELDRVDIGTGTRPRTRVTAESVAAYIARHHRPGRKAA